MSIPKPGSSSKKNIDPKNNGDAAVRVRFLSENLQFYKSASIAFDQSNANMG
jgi:hypothetical protein